MPRNIELKASDLSFDRSLRAALEAGAEDRGWLQQLDTYFRAGHGRLKLREEGDRAELIAYARSDEPVERESKYQIVPVPEPAILKEALTAALGLLIVVEKSRRLLLWRNVRIHLDQVRGLGNYIELEAVAEPDSDLSSDYRNVAALRGALSITDERVLPVSYSDELLRVARERNSRGGRAQT